MWGFISVTTSDSDVCQIWMTIKHPFVFAGKAALHCSLPCSPVMDIGATCRWVQVFQADTTHHESIYIVYLRSALLAFCAEMSHRAGALSSDLVPKCQPLGGPSCPVVPQLATVPTPSLKALTFTRHHRAARGGVTFALFFISSSPREAFMPAPGVR